MVGMTPSNQFLAAKGKPNARPDGAMATLQHMTPTLANFGGAEAEPGPSCSSTRTGDSISSPPDAKGDPLTEDGWPPLPFGLTRGFFSPGDTTGSA
ncbi:MAG: hypothetical protein CM15mP78_08170 [Candidatus Poseidoniales archaeon]|nr:MAG: hypothetical protein CM15mP78_08170 [Candidatus Poseidoniales archaeon]